MLADRPARDDPAQSVHKASCPSALGKPPKICPRSTHEHNRTQDLPDEMAPRLQASAQPRRPGFAVILMPICGSCVVGDDLLQGSMAVPAEKITVCSPWPGMHSSQKTAESASTPGTSDDQPPAKEPRGPVPTSSVIFRCPRAEYVSLIIVGIRASLLGLRECRLPP